MVSNLTVKVGADIQGLQKELQKASGQLQGFGKQMKSIGGMVAGAFAAGAFLSIGKGILDVTVEFQKFEAVLTNTLGSKSAAQAAMSQIQEFAAKTPFQVNELTSSFVKLANQGFLPTIKEMTSLGDLASAMGKSFDQLTEAIIDAQTGEFERLKEFGIRAQKQGDQVAFTFKGVKTQVDFTSAAIRGYILSLGQAEGVSGGMAKQNETLGGKISNLKDAFDQLQLAMGQLLTKGGVVNTFLEDLARMVQMTAGTFKGDQKLGIENIIKNLKELQAEEEKGSQRWIMLNDEILTAEGALRRVIAKEEELARVQAAAAAASAEAAAAEQARLAALENAAIKRLQIGAGGLQIGIAGQTGSDFMFASGAMVSMANVGSNALTRLNGALKINSNEFAVWASKSQAHIQQMAEKIELDFAPMIQSSLSGIGQALGSAINGSARLGDSLLKVLGGVLVQLGEMLIATGLGIKAFKVSLESLNWALALGMGVALVGMGSAIAGSIKSLGSSSGSSGRSAATTGGGNGSSPGGMSNQGMEITLGGSWKISGADLVYIFNRQQQLRGRTAG